MSSFKLIKMTEMSPLHVGAGRDTYDVAAGLPASDALSAALAAMRVMRGDSADIDKWMGRFALSSAFPYATIDGKDVFFLPAPRGRLAVKVRDKKEEDYRKSLKKVLYIAVSVWQRLVGGETVEVEEGQLQGAFLLDAEPMQFAAPYERHTNTRVAVSRSDKDANPFDFDWTYFRKGAGLCCLVDCDDSVFGEVAELFAELGEQGFGCDRGVGGGHFHVETGEISITEDATGDKQLLLSNYIPAEGEMANVDLKTSTYQIIRRGGFIAGSEDDKIRHLRRNVVNMIACGSVLATAVKPEGKIVDLSPNAVAHRVWRSGKPISVTARLVREDHRL